jgi:hypothetical protein
MTLSSAEIDSEDQVHMRIAQWLDIMLPPGSIWHHSPNEGNRHVAFKVKQKRMGTRPGWPDIEIFVPGDQTLSGASLSIFIEVKGRKGKATINQVHIADKLELAGAYWALCRSVDQVHEFLEGLIKLRGK